MVGEGDVKATDFLTSLAALALHCFNLASGEPGMGGSGDGLGVWRRGLCPSPLIKFRLPLPLSWLRGPGILKMRGNDQRKTVKNYINMYLK